MKICALSIVVLAASCASVSPANVSTPETPAFDAGSEASSKLGVYLGLRSFDESDWSPVQEQGTAGLEYVHEAMDSAVGVEVAVFAAERTEDDFGISSTTEVDFRGRTSELDLGLHKSFPCRYGGVHPYLGGGLSLLRADLRGASGGSPGEDHDTSTGLYFHGGVDVDFSPNFFLGLDLRLRGGTQVELLDESVSAGYGQVGLVLGVRF